MDAKKKYLMSTLLLLASFFIVKNSQAMKYTNFNGVFHYDGSFLTFDRQDGSSPASLNPIATNRPFLWATSTARSLFGSTTSVSVVSLIVKNTESGKSISGTFACSDGTGAHSGTSASWPLQEAPGMQGVRYYFSTPVTCDFSTMTSFSFDPDQTDTLDYTKTWWSGTEQNLNNGLGITNFSVYNYNYTLTFSINDPFNVLTNESLNEVASITGCHETNFTVASVDIGNGICEILSFLFVPSQNTLDQFEDISTSLQTKIPFSYFYDITTAVSSQATTSTATPVSFNLVASSSAFTFTYSPFSTTTAVAWMGQTNYNLFQTLMRYGILAAFGFYLFFRVRGLLSKHQK